MKNFQTISEFHRFLNIPAPQHPLISVIDVATVPHADNVVSMNMALDFYSIAVKRMENVKVKYGQQDYDFNEGVMSFMAPKQVFNIAIINNNKAATKTGWVIYVHADFIWKTALATTIKNYDFWDYSLNESLFLSPKEETIVNNIIQYIYNEYCSTTDSFSKQIIVSHIENLLNYANRFYHRQFITREKPNHHVLERLESLLDNYFTGNDVAEKGLPSVNYIADQLHLSPKYLSNLLRSLTNQNTQQHIHNKLIEKAKEKLSTTHFTVSEIAYQLGFEHLQSFSKLFKSKTNFSPIAFRNSFN